MGGEETLFAKNDTDAIHRAIGYYEKLEKYPISPDNVDNIFRMINEDKDSREIVKFLAG